jgi:DNA (cytosine-5)-methyltransferase 1
VNYYNENDLKAAAWLRELIAAGELPPGIVDERSIADVRKSDLDGYTQFHTFCGIGGWPLALKLAGWPEDQPVWTGSCPCQPFSQSGAGQVDKDERHLWPDFRAAIAECRPPVIFGEQVSGKDGRIWLAGVRADLEALGYGLGAVDTCAAGIGAPHIRQRLYWMAYAKHAERWPKYHEHEEAHRRNRLGGSSTAGRLADAKGERRQHESQVVGVDAEVPRPTESQFGVGGDSHTRRLADPQSGGLGINGSAPGSCGHVDERGEIERLANTNGGITGRGELQSGGKHGLIAQNGKPVERVGDTDGSRSQGRGLQPRSDAGQRSPWSSGFEIVHCTDGKQRKFERGTFPLAYGVPQGVVSGGDPSLSEVQNTKEARVMRLRGYGNAIVPQVAAQFIMACMDVLRFDLNSCDSKTQ